MKTPAEILEALKRGPTDVVGLDVSRGAVRAVRMRKNSDGLTLMGVDLMELPPHDEASEDTKLEPLTFSPAIKGQYASLAVDSGPAIIRLLTLNLKDNAGLDEHVIENLGLENPEDYRISYTMLGEPGARPETRLVAVAYPDALAPLPLALLPTAGIPAPHSIEVAGLAAMTAFMNGPVAVREKDTLGMIEFGETSSLFAFFNRGTPVLIRKLDRGTSALLERVQATLGIDRSTAEGLIADGSFDISAAAAEVMQPLIRQLVVSRDFVERRENCKVDAVYLAGGLAASHDIQNEISNALTVSVETWNPFMNVTVSADAIPEALQGKEWQFAAAAGACMGTLEEA